MSPRHCDSARRVRVRSIRSTRRPKRGAAAHHDHYVSDMDSSNAPTRPLDLADKEQHLIGWFRSQGSVLVGFSGGVDSAYLACVAVDALGSANVLAVIGRSPSFPDVQWQTARDVAARFGVPVLELDTAELDDPRYA